MKRVVITGMGIWSSIGQDIQTVTESLRCGCCGIIYDAERVAYGYQTGLVGNIPRPDLKPYLSRQKRLLMSVDSEYAYMAARQAFEQAGISEEYRMSHPVGIIFGSDGNSHQQEYAQRMEQDHSTYLVGYNALFRSITSSVTINLSTLYHLQGIHLTIGAACASAAQAVGIATMFIRQGHELMILVGGASEVEKKNLNSIVTDSLIMDSPYLTQPALASRPFDQAAAGCIVSGGAAALVLEEYHHALARGATILAEISGYGYAGGGLDNVYDANFNNDFQSMKMALADANKSVCDLDFIHARADSHPLSDKAEAQALAMLLGKCNTPISSTDSIAGHEGWTAGANRMVYSLLMMQNNFIAPSLNIENPIEEAKELNIVRSKVDKDLHTILLNAAGVGGSNCAFVLTNNFY